MLFVDVMRLKKRNGQFDHLDGLTEMIPYFGGRGWLV